MLSNSVAIVLREYHGPQASELSKFILLCDRFFDCLNTRSLVEDVRTRKPDMAPYRHIDDERFTVSLWVYCFGVPFNPICTIPHFFH